MEEIEAMGEDDRVAFFVNYDAPHAHTWVAGDEDMSSIAPMLVDYLPDELVFNQDADLRQNFDHLLERLPPNATFDKRLNSTALHAYSMYRMDVYGVARIFTALNRQVDGARLIDSTLMFLMSDNGGANRYTATTSSSVAPSEFMAVGAKGNTAPGGIFVGMGVRDGRGS